VLPVKEGSVRYWINKEEHIPHHRWMMVFKVRPPVAVGPDAHPVAVLPARLEFPSVAVTLSVVEHAFSIYRPCFPVALRLG